MEADDVEAAPPLLLVPMPLAVGHHPDLLEHLLQELCLLLHNRDIGHHDNRLPALCNDPSDGEHVGDQRLPRGRRRRVHEVAFARQQSGERQALGLPRIHLGDGASRETHDDLPLQPPLWMRETERVARVPVRRGRGRRRGERCLGLPRTGERRRRRRGLAAAPVGRHLECVCHLVVVAVVVVGVAVAVAVVGESLPLGRQVRRVGQSTWRALPPFAPQRVLCRNGQPVGAGHRLSVCLSVCLSRFPLRPLGRRKVRAVPRSAVSDS